MAGRTKAAGMALVVAALGSMLAQPAYPQGLAKKSGRSGPPTESRPKVDEKAYKAALDRIPTPKRGYDPWGQVHSSESAKTSDKPNQK
jgi:hypothetical protein